MIWKEKVVLNDTISEKEKQKDRDELEHVKKCSIKRVNKRADEDGKPRKSKQVENREKNHDIYAFSRFVKLLKLLKNEN